MFQESSEERSFFEFFTSVEFNIVSGHRILSIICSCPVKAVCSRRDLPQIEQENRLIVLLLQLRQNN